jgi:hypothetical protein
MSSERTKYVTAEGSVTAKTGASAASCQSPASYGHIPVTHRSPSVVRTSLFLFACIVTHCNAGEVSLAVTMQAQYLSLRLHCNAGAVSLAPQPAMMSCRATSTRVVLPPPDGRQIFGVCKASASAHTHTHTLIYTQTQTQTHQVQTHTAEQDEVIAIGLLERLVARRRHKCKRRERLAHEHLS